jgi:cobalt-zinc-cadmium efflux system membrane fusion protein
MAHEQLRSFLQRLRRVVNPQGDGDVSDAQLLERFVSRHDEAAFEVLVWRHGGLVLNVCGRLLRHTEDREDAFQATFLALTRRAASIGKGEALGSWLYKVAYRVALRVRARSARHGTQQENGLALLASPSSGSEIGPDVRPVLDEEINRLPEKYRAALILCYLQSKTTAEAARQLGCARGTVCSRLAWARQRLRSCLTRRGLALSAAGLVAVLAPSPTPAAWVHGTVKAAVLFASGQASRDALSKPAIALAEGVLRAMVLSKLRIALGGLLILGVLGLGAGLGTKRVLADKAGDDEKPVLVRGSDGVRVPTGLFTKLGIQSAEVKLRGPERPRVLELPGSTALDPTRLTRIRCLAGPAEVVEIGKPAGKEEDRELRPGDKVRKGQLLARLRSPAVGDKKSDLFDALVQLRLDQDMLDRTEKARDTVPDITLLKVQRQVAAGRNVVNRARNTLLAWGIPEQEIEAIRKEAEESLKRKAKSETEEEHKARLERWTHIDLKAPMDGVIIERSVTQHEMVVDNTLNLFQIAQVNRLLVIANAPENELPTLNALQPHERKWSVRTVGPTSVGGLTGPIEEIGYLINPNQHTAIIKGYIDNPEGKLRAGQFITASITLSPPVGVLVLPAGAVVEEGHQTFVFIQPDPKKLFYEQRRVVVVRRGQDVVHIRSRLTPEQERQGFQTVRLGERVVTPGVVELKAILEDLKAGTDRD